MAAEVAVAAHIDPALHNHIAAVHNDSLTHCFGCSGRLLERASRRKRYMWFTTIATCANRRFDARAGGGVVGN
jgi:hypothetical protein